MTEGKDESVKISFDAFLALALLESEKKELESLPSNDELEKAYPSSKDFDKKMQKLFERYNLQSKRLPLRRGVRAIAICIVVLLALTSCVFMPVQRVRDAVISTVIEWKDEFADIIFSTKGDYTISAALPGEIEVTYIPEGFALESEQDGKTHFYALYTDSSGDYYVVEAAMIGRETNLSIDNENSTYATIETDDQKILWTSNINNIDTFIWIHEGCRFVLTSTTSLDESLLIAKNIRMR